MPATATVRREPALSLTLSATNVSHRYGAVVALAGVSVRASGGSVVALVGESGSGKTTLLRTFNRLVDPSGGRVEVGGTDVRSLDPVALRRRIGYVPQNGGLLPHWTVRRNAALVPRLVGMRDAGEAADDALARVGLDPTVYGDRLPRELSGGQRQRVALARAFAARQEAVLLDEPFAALDAISRADAHEAFERVRRELGITAVLVTHDLAEAARLADSVVVMRDGAVEQEGSAAELRSAPATPYVKSLFDRAIAAGRGLAGVFVAAWTLQVAFAGAAAAQMTQPATGAAAPAQPASKPGAGAPIVVASKPFGESYLLAEVFAQLLESRGIAVDRRPGLGATEVAFGALRTSAIDVYPEYTGTGLLAILRDTLSAAMRVDPRATFAHVARAFDAKFGVRWLPPLGFQNGYAIAVRRETAARLGLRTITDLARVGPGLTAGFTSDFIGRPDGLPGLARAYGLTLRSVRPLAPAVKYTAIAEKAVDVIDGYSTDGLLAKYDLVTLADDRGFFPPYEAAAIVSPRVATARPDVVDALSMLSGRLDEAQMRAYNLRVEVDREDIRAVARAALRDLALVGSADSGALSAPNGPGARNVATGGASASLPAFLWSRRGETAALALRHLALVATALLAAVLVALPLGLALERARGSAEWVVTSLGVLQTIPSIALLAFMIPLLGVGVKPALVALWLYALYPIARNTYTGVRDADPEAVAACEAMGATARQRLLWVRLPIAAPIILAGIRTAAVITIGAATLAAFIGAGGLGEPIVTGLALADSRLVLAGAIPAALLAILVDGALALVERAVAPAHLRAGTRPQPTG